MLEYAIVEYLLANYTFLRARAENLGLELDTIVRSKLAETRSAEIEMLALAVHGYDGICVQTSDISDLTAWVAENYDTISAVCFQQSEQEIMQEILVLGNLVQKVDTALNALKRDELRVVDLRYVQRLTWAEVGSKMGLSRQRCSTIRGKAMSKLQRMLYLSDEERVLLAGYVQTGEGECGV